MKNTILPLLTFVFFTLSSCSKESDDYFDTKSIIYTFSAGGNDASYSLYSNKEGETIGGKTHGLYNYKDEVRVGDKITLTLSAAKLIEGRNFEIRVSMDEKIIFSSDEVNGFPSTIVINNTLDKSLFKR